MTPDEQRQLDHLHSRIELLIHRLNEWRRRAIVMALLNLILFVAVAVLAARVS